MVRTVSCMHGQNFHLVDKGISVCKCGIAAPPSYFSNPYADMDLGVHFLYACFGFYSKLPHKPVLIYNHTNCNFGLTRMNTNRAYNSRYIRATIRYCGKTLRSITYHCLPNCKRIVGYTSYVFVKM